MLNVEELNLLMEFDVSSLQTAMEDIRNSLRFMDDHELKTMCHSLLKKLQAMSEESFKEIDLSVVKEDNAYGE